MHDCFATWLSWKQHHVLNALEGFSVEKKVGDNVRKIGKDKRSSKI